MIPPAISSKGRELHEEETLLVLLGNIELVLDEIPEGHPSGEADLQSSLAAGTRMTRLLQGFSQMEPTFGIDFVDLLEGVAKQAEGVNPGLRVIVKADDNCRGIGIRSRLLPMVFDNLFRNAAIHAGESPIVRVTVSIQDSGLKIIVADDGPGIDPRVRDRLFKRGATTGNGSGLGLYLTRKILEHQGGSIELTEPVPSGGTCFSINLPSSSLKFSNKTLMV